MSYPVSTPSAENGRPYTRYVILSLSLVLVVALAFGGYKIVFTPPVTSGGTPSNNTAATATAPLEEKEVVKPVIASPEEYDRKIQHIVNGDSSGKWPVKKRLSIRRVRSSI